MHKLLVLAIFAAAYLVIIFKRGFHLAAVWSAVVLLLSLRLISPKDALDSVNFNVLGIFAGTSILSTLFVFSKAPDFLANKLASRAKTTGAAVLAVCALAGFISSFVENIVTVMIVAPLAFELAKRLKVSPAVFLIGVAISSNLQGCATMIGDSPSIILAGFAQMNFMDFFWMRSRPGIFFAVELGALCSGLVLYAAFRKYKQPNTAEFPSEKINTLVPAVLFIMMIASLAASSFFPGRSVYAASKICLSFAAAGLAWHLITHKEKIAPIRDFDWRTFVFLAGVFVLVGSLTKSGIVADIARGISYISAGSAFTAYTVIVWASVLLSAFVDNIPYTMAMLPAAAMVAENMGVSPYPYFFGLLIGSCLGGNITPVGAAANIVSVGMLKKKGCDVSFTEFAKIGLPFTLAAVTAAYIFIWLVWGR